jgi:cell division septal protein FtsQ
MQGLIMKIFVNRWFLFSVIFLGFIIYAGYTQKQFFEIQHVKLNMEYDEIDTPDLEKTKKDFEQYFSEFKGQWIFKLPLSKVDQWAKKDNRIERYAIRKIYPNKLDIKIKLRKMAIIYLDQRGRFYPVSVNGGLLPQTKLAHISGRVILRGSEIAKDKRRAQEAISLVNFINQFDELKESEISEITFKKDEGFNIFLNHQDIVIKLGFDDLKKRAEKVRRVLEYLKNEKVNSCVIDARLGKKVVVKLRNET